MKKVDYFVIAGDAILCLNALITILSGRSTVHGWIVLFFTVLILSGYVSKIVAEAKKKRQAPKETDSGGENDVTPFL